MLVIDTLYLIQSHRTLALYVLWANEIETQGVNCTIMMSSGSRVHMLQSAIKEFGQKSGGTDIGERKRARKRAAETRTPATRDADAQRKRQRAEERVRFAEQEERRRQAATRAYDTREAAVRNPTQDTAGDDAFLVPFRTI